MTQKSSNKTVILRVLHGSFNMSQSFCVAQTTQDACQFIDMRSLRFLHQKIEVMPHVILFISSPPFSAELFACVTP